MNPSDDAQHKTEASVRALARDDTLVVAEHEQERPPEGSRMRLVEPHRIDRHDARFATIDAAASKHRYNAAPSRTRQAFIHQQRIISYEELARDMKTSVEYRALPAKVAQWALLDQPFEPYVASFVETILDGIRR